MRTKIGIGFVVLGSVLVFLALGLFLLNTYEQKQAAEAVEQVMPQLVEVIQARQDSPTEATTPDGEEQSAPIVAPQPPQKKMPVVEIDGNPYIGFVAIPALELELPVMDDWNYQKLQKTPCRFTGDMYSDDLVVMAHNFSDHFGLLKNLRVGDIVFFTDMDGTTVRYTVVAVDVLQPTAVEEMTSGEYDLTLFTCTYGGKARVTIRCDRLETRYT